MAATMTPRYSTALGIALVMLTFCGAQIRGQDKAKLPGICETDLALLDPTDRSIDAQHPKYFVEVSEVSSRGRGRVIHTSVPSAIGPERLVCQRINAPVDIESKIVLRVNKTFLELNRFEGKFAITARVDGASGSRPVEVPGYSVIGKASEGDPVRVADLTGMTAAMREIRKEQALIARDLAAAFTRANRATPAAKEAARTHADDVFGLRARLRADSLLLRASLERVRAATDSVRRGLLDTTSTIARAGASVEEARTQWRQRQDSLARAEATLHNDSVSLIQGAVRDYLVQARRVFSERRHALTAIDAIAAPENAPLVRMYARAQGRLPELVVRVAQSSDSLWRDLVAQDFTTVADSLLQSWNGTVGDLNAALHELGETNDPLQDERVLGTLSINAMRDAEITIRQTGAQVGDILVITVSDTVGDPGANRTLELRLPIREFGFVRRVSDAVLLMNVPGLNEAPEIDAAQLQADNAGQGSTLSFPLNLRGAPSAGVTLGWTYLPRLDDDYAKVLYPVRVIFNWLRPGVGMNASVVSIAHKIMTITPHERVNEAAKEPEVAYTFGMVTSVFDNALQWSLGRTLTGDRARTYTAIGISFLAATDKAKDLFKALAK
jgi:hypothetical protein